MKKWIAITCCVLTLAGCGSTPASAPEPETAKETEVIPATEGYQAVQIGGFNAEIPSDWIISGEYFYADTEGDYPFVYASVHDGYGSLDDAFQTAEDIKYYTDEIAAEIDQVTLQDEMFRHTYGENTGLEFMFGGLHDNRNVASIVTLFSNPGGGIVTISCMIDLENRGDFSDEFTKLLFSLSPSAGLDKPSDSFQPTTGDKNALAQAHNYLSSMHFSYSGLKEQLMYEQYTDREATYAVDNCNANWNEQAVGKAQDYLDSMSFSRAELIEQLEFEGFTHDQSEYGVSQVYD